jgi:DNA-binding SARP family transcriptional activator
MGGVRFNVLGAMEVRTGDEMVDLGPRMVRAVLAALLVEVNKPVTTDRLIDQLWGENPPATAGSALQVHISALRRTLEPDRRRGEPPGIVLTQGSGYVLRVDPANVDAWRFEAGTLEACRELAGGRPRRVREKADEALSLWRGQPYADLAFESFVQPEIARLEQLRSTAMEAAMEAELALGNHAAMISELERLVALHPLRERLRELFILALYRSGRQAEALRAYEDARRTLGDELGIEPSPSLQRLEADILQQASSLDWQPTADGRATDLGSVDLGDVTLEWAGASVALTDERMTIGRSESSSIPLDDAAVSRLHAVLQCYPGGWSIRDLGSANGTFVNGEPLAGEQQLRPGDEIRVGSISLVFRSRQRSASRATLRWPGEGPA